MVRIVVGDAARLRMLSRFEMSALERDFWLFHYANPRVYELYKQFARKAIDRGYRRFSSDLLCHRIRWEVMLETTDPDFKINDHHTAYYARLWLIDHPNEVKLFSLRNIKGGLSALLSPA